MLISGIQDAGSEAYRFRIRVFHVIPKDVILKEKRGGVCMFQDKMAVVTAARAESENASRRSLKNGARRFA